jgi:hypothetical protein
MIHAFFRGHDNCGTCASACRQPQQQPHRVIVIAAQVGGGEAEAKLSALATSRLVPPGGKSVPKRTFASVTLAHSWQSMLWQERP